MKQCHSPTHYKHSEMIRLQFFQRPQESPLLVVRLTRRSNNANEKITIHAAFIVVALSSNLSEGLLQQVFELFRLHELFGRCRLKIPKILSQATNDFINPVDFPVGSDSAQHTSNRTTQPWTGFRSPAPPR